MNIESLQKGDEKKWNDFVDNHPQGQFVHLTFYKDILEKTFNYKGKYLYLQKEGKILSEEGLRYFLKQHLAHFKVPHYFEFKDSLPKNRTGKIDKEQLRK